MKRHINNIFLSVLISLLIVTSFHLYAQAPDTWTKKADFGGGERSGAASFSINGKGYIGTGYIGSSGRQKDFWEYDPSTNVWTQKTDFGGTARYYATGFSIGNKGYIVCGNDNVDPAIGGTTNDVWEFDPAGSDGKGTWTQKKSFPGMARMGGVGFSIGSKGYFGTGEHIIDSIYTRINDFWEFDPNAATDGMGTWTEKTKINDDVSLIRAFAVGFSIGNKGYIGTGHYLNSDKYKDFWEYNPAFDTWTKKTDFPGVNRWQAVGISIGAYGYVGLGDNRSDFYEYNPATNTWTTPKASSPFPPPPGYIAQAAGFSIGNKLYIGTGTAVSGSKSHYKDFYEYTPAAIWSGATSNDWNTGTNWLSNQAPASGTDIIIPVVSTSYPVISNAASCKNLTINKGAVLTIAAGNSLTVTGTLVDSLSSGLIIKSDASGTGSLIHSTTGVPANIERYQVGDWSAAKSGWHLISSPVESQAISNFTSSGAGNGYDFYGWNELSNLWMNYKASPSFSDWNGGINFNIGEGYIISYEATHTGTFSGNINVSSVTKSNLTLSAGENFSWHLLGNPFSSALKWNDGNWAVSNVAGNAKIWNASAESYSDIGPGGTIPMEQGFMISVNNSTNRITIPTASRIINNTLWYKSSENQHIMLLASEQGGESYQESQILINPLATKGFDFDYDSRFLPGYAPQFFSVSGNENLSTNSLPSLNGEDIISFDFIKNESNLFKIELRESIEGQRVYLTDLKIDSTQNLSENPVYSFSSTEGDDPARFKLHFQDFTALDQETFSLYQSNGNINITTFQKVNAEIIISNLLGQVVLHAETNGNLITSLNAETLQGGVYMVSLKANNKVASKKLVLSK